MASLKQLSYHYFKRLHNKCKIAKTYTIKDDFDSIIRKTKTNTKKVYLSYVRKYTPEHKNLLNNTNHALI